MEKTIPNFNQHRRWFLRSLPNDELEFFAQNGTYIGNLSLTEQEYEQFNQKVKNIIDSSVQKIENGTHKYWQIRTNEIGTNLAQSGMSDAWRYHKTNNRTLDEFSNNEWPEYNWTTACDNDLKTVINKIFDAQIDSLSKTSSNPFIIKAKIELDEERKNQATIYSLSEEYDFEAKTRDLTEEEKQIIINTLFPTSNHFIDSSDSVEIKR